MGISFYHQAEVSPDLWYQGQENRCWLGLRFCEIRWSSHFEIGKLIEWVCSEQGAR